jgi:glycosyltransferase involved in cell wall biosynthesis
MPERQGKKALTEGLTVNAPDYWDHRFQTDWEERGGRGQTQFFAELAIQHLPDWFVKEVKSRHYELYDFGCALGDALPVFRKIFPDNPLRGGDVTPAGIEKAAQAWPDFRFEVLDPTKPPPETDIHFCSNTLEHFRDWREKLAALAIASRHGLVILVPFGEKERISEHEVTFTYASLPQKISGLSLVWLTVFDTARLENTRWPGRQMLALYQRQPSSHPLPLLETRDDSVMLAPAQLEPQDYALSTRIADGFDALIDQHPLIRHRIPELEKALAEMRAFYDTSNTLALTLRGQLDILSEEHETLKIRLQHQGTRLGEMQKENDAKDVIHGHLQAINMQLDLRCTELKKQISTGEEAISSLNRLNTQLEEKLIALDYRLITAGKQEETAHARIADLTAHLEEASARRRELDTKLAEKTRLEEALNQSLSEYKATLEQQRLEGVREREIASHRIADLTAHLEEASTRQTALEATLADKTQLEDALNQSLSGYKTALEQKQLDLAREREIASHRIGELQASLDLAAQRHTDIQKQLEISEDINSHLNAIQQQMETRLADSEALHAATLAAQAAALTEQQTMTDGFEAKIATLMLERDRESAEKQQLHTSITQFNTLLARREQELRGEFYGVRQVLMRILNSRSWRMTVRAITRLQRLRRRPYTPPALPPVGDLSLPRFTGDAPSVLELAHTPLLAVPLALPVAVQEPEASSLPCEGGVLITVEMLHRGGVEQVVVDLACGFATLGTPVAVAISGSGGDCADVLRRKGICVEAFAHDSASYRSFLARIKPRFALMNHSYFGLDLLREQAVPVIEIVHNYYVWHQDHPQAYREWTTSVDRFAAVSSGVAEYHAKAFGLSREAITVINNPINREGLLRPEPEVLRRLRLKALRTQLTFVNVAQFYPAKAHALLLTAFSEVHACHPQAKLVLIGQAMDGDVTRRVHEIIERLSLKDAVDITGFIDRRSLSLRLATAHAFVQPSVYEGFSVAMAEAAHFALPLVATRIGGALDLVSENDCGLLIPPHIEDFLKLKHADIPASGMKERPACLPSLVEAMETIARNPQDWLERGFLAQSRIDALTPESVARRYLNLADGWI